MKTKFLLTISVLLIAMSFTGCGKAESSAESDNTVKITDTTEHEDEYICSTSELDQNGYAIEPSNPMKGNITIPDYYMDNPVVELNDYAFATHEITDVKMGANVLEIGENTFFDCSALKKVELNDKLKTIGQSAFLQSGLEGDLVIPDSVERIESMAFALTKLDTIYVGKGVKYIGEEAFGIETLKKIVFDCTDAEFQEGTDIFNQNDTGLIIVAPKGSTAEKYAKDNNIKFEER